MTDKSKRESTSIKMDPALWKEAKIEAIKRDIDLSDLVEEALRKELRSVFGSGGRIEGGKLKGAKLE